MLLMLIRIVTKCNFSGKSVEDDIRVACEEMSDHCSSNNNNATLTNIVFLELVMKRIWEASDENGDHYTRKVSHINVTILDKKSYDYDNDGDYELMC